MKFKLCLYLAFLSLLSPSCSRRWCTIHYPVSIDSILITKDSIIRILKDTTVYVNLPGSIQFDSVFIPCKPTPSTFIPDTAILKTSFAIAKAWFKYPVIKLSLKQIDTTLKIRLEDAIRESEYWKYKFSKVNRVEEKKVIPGFYKFCTFAFIGICLALIAYIVLKLFRI